MSTSTDGTDRRDAIGAGAALIAAGIGLALHRAGTIDGAELVRGWWPLVIVLAGTWRTAFGGSRATGLALVALGLGLLAVLRSGAEASAGALLGPAAMILVGVAALSAASSLRQAVWHSDGSALRTVAVFGDARATVGEDAPDLPEAARSVVSVFGDVHGDVPAGWRIEDHVTNVAGSVRMPSDQPSYPEAPTLTLHGLAVFGDVRARYVDLPEAPR